MKEEAAKNSCKRKNKEMEQCPSASLDFSDIGQHCAARTIIRVTVKRSMVKILR